MRVAQVGLAVGPIITEQPQSRSICPGASATLSVRASGASSYQWETSTDGAAWAPISGATASTLTATPSTTAYYRAVTSNAAGATTSDIATLTPVALATEPAANILYGDVTRDGAVNSADATFLRAVLAGKQPLAVPSAVADLNGDTKVDALDLALVTAYATSTITCLPQFPVTIVTTASTAPVVATVASLTRVATQTSLNPTQYFFYTAEKTLLSHTTIQSGGGTPQISSDYIWFAGVPVAEETIAASSSVHFTFTDHLGSPFLQTDTTGTARWHVGYEPYGAVYRTRTGSASDQRLRFPGQEYDEQTPERAYNIFRWYRSGRGRYTQSDPIGLAGGLDLYGYALANPLTFVDPGGLSAASIWKWVFGGLCSAADGPLPFGEMVLVAAISTTLADVGKECDKCGDCTPNQHTFLQSLVNQHCKSTPRKCTGNQDLQTLQANLAANVTCALARDDINNHCYKGGDEGHRTAANEARAAAAKCLGYIWNLTKQKPNWIDPNNP